MGSWCLCLVSKIFTAEYLCQMFSSKRKERRGAWLSLDEVGKFYSVLGEFCSIDTALPRRTWGCLWDATPATNQSCALPAHKANCVLGCIQSSWGSRTREGILPHQVRATCRAVPARGSHTGRTRSCCCESRGSQDDQRDGAALL